MKTILLLICLFMILGVVSAFNTGNWYYAYGDSITRATGYGDLPTDGSANYVLQMKDVYDPYAPADHNIDGAGWTSWLARGNLSTHVDFTNGQLPEGKRPVVVYMLGVNDQVYNVTPRDYAANIIRMQQYLEVNKSYAVPVLPVLMMSSPFYPWSNYTRQATWIQEVEMNFTRHQLWYVKGYDAVDSIPNNGVLDQWNKTNFADSIHLNVTGHRALGKYVWQQLQERDKT